MRYLSLWMITAVVFPAVLFAHGVEVFDASAEAVDRSAAVRFLYSTGEPMMYAKIRVYPPSTPQTEILQSITDRNGIFSFIPDETGEWQIDAEDGMGHKGSITILISNLENSMSGEEPPSRAVSGKNEQSTPLFLRILLGLSLILNIFAIYNFVLHIGIAKEKKNAH